MGICWYCHWGWPKPVFDVWAEALAALDDYEDVLTSGPASAVWADENFDEGTILGCLALCDSRPAKADFTAEELGAVRRSLVALLAIPEAVRDCRPEDYDGENPEDFPPPAGAEMVKA